MAVPPCVNPVIDWTVQAIPLFMPEISWDLAQLPQQHLMNNCHRKLMVGIYFRRREEPSWVEFLEYSLEKR